MTKAPAETNAPTVKQRGRVIRTPEEQERLNAKTKERYDAEAVVRVAAAAVRDANIKAHEDEREAARLADRRAVIDRRLRERAGETGAEKKDSRIAEDGTRLAESAMDNARTNAPAAVKQRGKVIRTPEEQERLNAETKARYDAEAVVRVAAAAVRDANIKAHEDEREAARLADRRAVIDRRLRERAEETGAEKKDSRIAEDGTRLAESAMDNACKTVDAKAEAGRAMERAVEEAAAVARSKEEAAGKREAGEREAAANRGEAKENFLSSAKNLIGKEGNEEFGGFIHKKDEIARVKKVIGYFKTNTSLENTSLDDPEKMRDVIWVASQINLVRNLRKKPLAEGNSNDPMKDPTDFVVGLVAATKNLGKENVQKIAEQLLHGKNNDELHKKLIELRLTEPTEQAVVTTPPSPSPKPTSCYNFLEHIAKKITNLVGQVFGSSAEKEPASHKAPSTTCQPKGFKQLAGEMLERIGNIFSR